MRIEGKRWGVDLGRDRYGPPAALSGYRPGVPVDIHTEDYLKKRLCPQAASSHFMAYLMMVTKASSSPRGLIP